MDYFEKIDKNPYEDLKWNVPEQKMGTVNVIGGDAQHFRAEVKVAEFLDAEYPLREVGVVLPESLRGKLPELPNFRFLPATESGSFANSEELKNVFAVADANLVLGDLSRNSVTGKAVADAVIMAEKMTMLTRDSVDLIADNQPERWLMNENVVVMASMPQLVKILKAVYYPKMLLMSQSLVQVAEVLHKFTLSYPVRVVTLHSGQILVACNGVVKAIDMAVSGYSPIMIWGGELAAKIVAMNLYNPGDFVGATCAAVFD